jgi:hypothetical protein
MLNCILSYCSDFIMCKIAQIILYFASVGKLRMLCPLIQSYYVLQFSEENYSVPLSLVLSKLYFETQLGLLWWIFFDMRIHVLYVTNESGGSCLEIGVCSCIKKYEVMKQTQFIESQSLLNCPVLKVQGSIFLRHFICLFMCEGFLLPFGIFLGNDTHVP